MEHDEAGCQAPERPILCINNCGFFGRPSTMNMCSKCHKDYILKQEQDKLVAASIDSAVNRSESSGANLQDIFETPIGVIEQQVPVDLTKKDDLGSTDGSKAKAKDGPSRCNACNKRVGLTGFSCRCGNLFCASHRYSETHNCPFDYRMAARDAISKANPVVKAEKLDKI
ncbi:hypothetical protein HPP92_007244 [Vanilla planifolia]|uniref:Zinc finger A20 and AN1 domain-containing stress-associated protein 8 n=1 Tax=Vanilla planifolia TaxID=51239 RepID=A0A835RK25_VANPL|nr:hypothetical protein HPP92_007244 [Vanilla planifolia]